MRSVMIITKSEYDREYSKSVQTGFQLLDFNVELNFINPNVEITDSYLKDVRTLGHAFAININFENELRKSVTLYVLRGEKLEEHRNIILCEAYALAIEKYNSVKEFEGGYVPESLKHNFISLQKGQHLTRRQYKLCISYLQYRMSRCGDVKDLKKYKA